MSKTQESGKRGEFRQASGASCFSAFFPKLAGVIAIAAGLLCLLQFPAKAGDFGGAESGPAACIGEQDSLVVRSCGDDQTVWFSENQHKQLIPASIIKLLTCLAAFHYLGPDFHFETEIYRRGQRDIVLKGYGDPCFVSREIARAAAAVRKTFPSVRDILVDDSFFAPGITVPGRTRDSREPYNAPNGALCANYNSIAVARRNGAFVSAEPETPLLPFALRRLQDRPEVTGRVLLIRDQAEAPLYAGELLACFLKRYGCEVRGEIKRGRIDAAQDTLVIRQTSAYSLSEVVEKLLRYSNNFIANQLLLRCGSRVYGPPATLAKGVRAVRHYARVVLKIDDFQLVEGSGLSRRNRISAAAMSQIMTAFFPYHELMRQKGEDYYKTGNLQGVSTRVGYLENGRKEMVSYVIMVNTPGKIATVVLAAVKSRVEHYGEDE